MMMIHHIYLTGFIHRPTPSQQSTVSHTPDTPTMMIPTSITFSTSARALSQRAMLSLTTFPDATGWKTTAFITLTTTATSGLVAASSGVIDPIQDYDPPWSSVQSFSDGRNSSTSGSEETSSPIPSSLWYRAIVKPLSAFVFPSFVEEFIWRGLLIPHPSSTTAQIVVSSPGGHINASITTIIAMTVLVVHVLSHPIVGWTVWPRGRQIFDDPGFLVLASIVLGGATASYVLTGGSVWAATITHGLPVMLWRDFFGGEAKLLLSSSYELISKEKDK